MEKKRNIENETTNTINLSPSNITKCELVMEGITNTKSNPSRQQKQHKQFAFIIGDNMVKDLDSYLLTGSFQKKIYCEGAAFFVGQNGGHAGLY